MGALLGALLGIALWVYLSIASDFPILAGTAITFFAGRGFMMMRKAIEVHPMRSPGCLAAHSRLPLRRMAQLVAS